MVDLRLTKLLRPQPEQEAQMLRATVARGVGQLGATAMFGRRADVSRTRLPLVKQSTLAKRLRQRAAATDIPPDRAEATRLRPPVWAVWNGPLPG